MPFLVLLFVAVAAAAIAIALAPQPQAPKPASMEDFSIPTAEPGRPIPVVFGTIMVTGANIVWYGDLAYIPVKTKSGK